MFFLKVKIQIQHVKFKSLNKTYKLKNNKFKVFLDRTKNQKDWQIKITYKTLNNKSISTLTDFFEIENKKYTIKEFNTYAQNTNILFR